MKGERFMADYSDKLIRALIREMINEDRANKAEAIVGGPTKALAIWKAAKLLRAILTPGGIALAVTLGLMYEKEFTVATLKLAGKTAADLVEAIVEFVKLKGLGHSTFHAIAEAGFEFQEENEKSKYRYYAALKEDAKKSKLSKTVDNLIEKATEVSYMDEDAINKYPKSDRAVIDAIVSKDFESIFTDELFVYNSSKNTISVKNASTVQDIESLLNNEADPPKELDKRIMKGIVSAAKAEKEGKKSEAQADMASAVRVYRAAKEMDSGDYDELTERAFLDNLDDIDQGISTGFARDLEILKDKFEDGTDTASTEIKKFLTDSFLEALKKGGPFTTSSQSQSSGGGSGSNP